MKFAAPLEGNWEISVTVGTNNINDSPFLAVIVPGTGISPFDSILTGYPSAKISLTLSKNVLGLNNSCKPWQGD